MRVRVVRTGPRSLLVAAPSSRRTSAGVPPSGPFDRGAWATGQALVGGRSDAAAFEVILGGLCFVTDSGAWVAVTGAEVPLLMDTLPVSGPLVWVPAGSELALGTPRRGLRTYVAVEGGLVSGRPGLLGGYGPQPVHEGDELLVRESVAPWPPPAVAVPSTLTVLPGPRLSHLADPGQLEGEWTVSLHSDRVGVRLDGPVLLRTGTSEVPPEGIVRGAIQAPPAGPIVVFGPDHPTTGGYPVVGVLTPGSVDVLAQKRPGERIRLRWG